MSAPLENAFDDVLSAHAERVMLAHAIADALAR
jgi:hypothetical protein